MSENFSKELVSAKTKMTETSAQLLLSNSSSNQLTLSPMKMKKLPIIGKSKLSEARDSSYHDPNFDTTSQTSMRSNKSLLTSKELGMSNSKMKLEPVEFSQLSHRKKTRNKGDKKMYE